MKSFLLFPAMWNMYDSHESRIIKKRDEWRESHSLNEKKKTKQSKGKIQFPSFEMSELTALSPAEPGH